MLKNLMISNAFASVASAAAVLAPRDVGNGDVSSCPGYSASNVQKTPTGMTAELSLAGPACNAYGRDIEDLTLMVNYDNAQRLHVKIEDSSKIAYQVPQDVFPTPDNSESVAPDLSDLSFEWNERPFTFKVTRKSNDEVLFDSSAAPLIFEDQYLRLRTALPEDPNLYGLGEHSDSLRMNTTDYTRTMWSRDAYGLPEGTNLYGNHPIYFDHRGDKGTHGVFLLSSAGMDVKINQTEKGEQYLEYNLLSGIFDLYFMAGSTPKEVSQQYAGVAGLPAMMPYWSLGFHNCRYGYRDFYSVAETVYNYSAAGIPLETQWTDIDYMWERAVFSVDPDRFTMERVRELVDYLHDHDQHYVVMVDPAVAYQTQTLDNATYEPFVSGRDQGIFLERNNSIFEGVVWPGKTAFPDWFNPDSQDYWTNQFASFFNKDSGIDIDGLWIDMNEAANFNFFGDNVANTVAKGKFPPARPEIRSQPRPIPGFPASFQPNASSPYPPDLLTYNAPWLAPASNPNAKRDLDQEISQSSMNMAPLKRQEMPADIIGYPNRNLLDPPYQINNENTYKSYGGLSNFTITTDVVHHGGYVDLDVHNMYGSMMSFHSRQALLARREERRPMIITRSTFAGAGREVGKWLGDNLSTWHLYRNSIQGMLNFASLFQVPLVGADICGFGGNTTTTLCSRWATLGSFYPFSRNHNGDTSIEQSYYYDPMVTAAAKNALDMRYRLLDYIYTAFQKQSSDGTPLLNPLFFNYPEDKNTFGIELQFFYGDSILVSPVTEENSTSVDAYIPNDRFYDFKTHTILEGRGEYVTFKDVDFTEIPLHIRGGSILPLRQKSGMTTAAVRKEPFDIVIAPGRDGKASGSLYLDDGDSIEQPKTSNIEFTYENGVLEIKGCFDYTSENARIAKVTVLDAEKPRGGHYWRHGRHGHGRGWGHGGPKMWQQCGSHYQHESRTVEVEVNAALDGEMTIKL